MAEAADRDQKTETPTPKRRTDAARNGDILHSKELSVALIMMAGAAWLFLAGPHFVQSCAALLTEGLQFSKQDLVAFEPQQRLVRLGVSILVPLPSLFGLGMGAAIAGPAMLGSAGFRTEALGFKASRINPWAGFARIFGVQGWVELGKALLKALVLGSIGYWVLQGDLPTLLSLGRGDAHHAVGLLGQKMTRALLWLAAGLVLIALIDVPIQLLRRNSRLRMTKQEVKDEMRQSEGSPELKQAQRQRQIALLSGSARKAVREASLILTNPTHFAVALRYVPGKDAAPTVVARGRGETALAIRELAKDCKVPMLEYPRLTRAIYFTARAGQPIAEDLYVAVATILAFVFNLDRALADGLAPPKVDVPLEKSFDERGAREAEIRAS
jgi:flagellar biosynthesis protein FlhB